jgi:glycosyltransferase involved in cell wall biosynthesis
MKISVIIPTLNEEGYIGSLLHELHEQTVKPYEIIVVDGGSTDKTTKIVSSFNDTLLIRSKKSVASQRNIGAKTARGDILVFLDADDRVKKNFVYNVTSYFITEKIDIACSQYVPYTSSLKIKVLFSYYNMLFWLFQKICPSGAGACIMIRYEVFNQGYGFDEKLKSFEDLEMIRRYGSKYRFGIASFDVGFSDRRFRKEGTRLILKYIALSFLGFLGMYSLASRLIIYEFGNHVVENENTISM